MPCTCLNSMILTWQLDASLSDLVLNDWRQNLFNTNFHLLITVIILIVLLALKFLTFDFFQTLCQPKYYKLKCQPVYIYLLIMLSLHLTNLTYIFRHYAKKKLKVTFNLAYHDSESDEQYFGFYLDHISIWKFVFITFS